MRESAVKLSLIIFERSGNELFQDRFINICQLVYIQAAHTRLVFAEPSQKVIKAHLADADIQR